MRSVVISSGHGKIVRGAAGYLDEVNEARKVTDTTADILKSANVPVKTFHDDKSTTQSANLQAIVNYHNAQKRDLDVSVHFNAYQTTAKAMGVEVLYVSQQQLATQLATAIAQATGLINRGAKKRTDLYFLNNTSKPAILIEVCFVDSRADADIYQTTFLDICRVIAVIVGDVTLPERPPTEPEEPGMPEPPVEPPIPLPPAEQAIVDITIRVTGNAVVNINGQDFQIGAPPLPVEPPVIPPPVEIWQTNIETTVFGGAKDPNNSAYPPFGYIDDTVLGCALPWKFAEPRPKVHVRNVANLQEVVVEILDLGPWMTTDCYWGNNTRPVAETCYKSRTPLPSGPNRGKVPTNSAGLDLTPAAARAIGLSGKGKCDWRIIEESTVDV